MKVIMTCFLLTFVFCFRMAAQDIFKPPANKKNIQAKFISENLKVDGKLTDNQWKQAIKKSSFTQIEPNQGSSPQLVTNVSVLFNDKYLYLGFFCADDNGIKGVRAPDMRRDFDEFIHDFCGVSIDAFRDERSAMVFETNPFSALRDLQSIDDRLNDLAWDGYWKARTNRTDTGWTAEMQIPWAILRYPKGEDQAWGINFYRKARRINEFTCWAPVPRAFSPYRMNYAGVINGLAPPKMGANIRIQPYMAFEAGKKQGSKEIQSKLKPGGEIKWGINSNSFLEGTVNTDFAQTEVDRQIVNLSRFSIYFPEKRQFFLDNGSFFSLGNSDATIPFFSRRIGLDPKGSPVPIIGGLKYINRSEKRELGSMMVNQHNNEMNQWATFGVLRYSQNLAKQNRLGGLVTTKITHGKEGKSLQKNYTSAIDGFFRFGQPLSWSFMASNTVDEASATGIAATSNLRYNHNWINLSLTQSYVDDKYNPGVGFVGRSNTIITNPGFYLNYRPKWKPGFVRSFEPGSYFFIYHNAANQKLMERLWVIMPVWVNTNSGGIFNVKIKPTYQNLALTFTPLEEIIQPGEYHYTRYSMYYQTDLSKKVSGSLFLETGKFYSGNLNVVSSTFNLAPVPNLYLSFTYELNSAYNFRNSNAIKNYHLFAPEVRVAVNPRLQLSGFYQLNELYDYQGLNVRFSWEYKPLSFLYLVYNGAGDNVQIGRLKNDNQAIFKISYAHQF